MKYDLRISVKDYRRGKNRNQHVVMRKLQIEDNDIMRIALQQEIRRSEESRYDHRLHGVLLVSHGLSCHRVADYLGEDPVTIQRWVHRFNEDGSADFPPHGIPPAQAPSTDRQS